MTVQQKPCACPRCERPREPGKMFCLLHIHASNRIYLPVHKVDPEWYDLKPEYR